jgi:hypothetical protein
MFSPSRRPERLVRLAQWLIALLFAFFLIRVGGALLADLPALSPPPQLDSFLQTPSITALEARLQPLQAERQGLEGRLNGLRQRQEVARQAYESDKASFDNWRSARSATAQTSQNPEVIARARQLDYQLQLQQRLGEERRGLERQLGATQATMAPFEARLAQLRAEGERLFQRARERTELRVFGLRLLLVGPLLAASLWQFRRYRGTEQWPFVWGFLLFGLFSFFFELVPYLPSFGAYIRYGVGALLTVVAGRALIRWLQDDLRRKRQEQAAPQEQRQREIRYEKALRSLDQSQCPSCERRLPAKDGDLPDFCMHCGLELRVDCPRCQFHHLSFFPYCPSCGLRRSL